MKLPGNTRFPGSFMLQKLSDPPKSEHFILQFYTGILS